MPLLPSGTHYCINSHPLDELLHAVSNGGGLHIPDLLLIHGPDDLRRYIRLLWLLPLGADCAVNPRLNPLSEPVPVGLTLVDSGYRMNQLPGHLDESDRCAMALFWESPRCRTFLDQLMDKVRALQNRMVSSATPEDLLLNQWFLPVPEWETPSPSEPESDEIPRANNKELRALLAEEEAEQAATISHF